MIEQKILTEKEYRAIDIDSYSSIKVFLDDRKKYYKKFILKEDLKEDDEGMAMGSLVHCLMLRPREFEDRYSLSEVPIPPGQYGEFAVKLWEITRMNLAEDGTIIRTMESMMQEAYSSIFKRDKFETVKTKFFGTEVEAYYKYLRDNHGKEVIDLKTLEVAKAIEGSLRSNIATADIMNLKSSRDYEVIDEFPIIGELDGSITKTVGFKLKGMIDKLVIDHRNKMIHIYDLKVLWDNEKNFKYGYLKNRYYIQNSTYFYLVVEWKKKQKGLEDYGVNFPKFVVAESNNYKVPLVYTTGMDNFNEGMRGFILNGEYYPGLIKAVRDLTWHKEMGIWNISRDNYENRGVVKLNTFQELKIKT